MVRVHYAENQVRSPTAFFGVEKMSLSLQFRQDLSTSIPRTEGVASYSFFTKFEGASSLPLPSSPPAAELIARFQCHGYFPLFSCYGYGSPRKQLKYSVLFASNLYSIFLSPPPSPPPLHAFFPQLMENHGFWCSRC